MKIIISPAKKMNVETDLLEYKSIPCFINDTEKIKEWLQEMSLEELKELWGCNDKIAEQNYERIQHMDLYKNLTPAILAYEGIQYQYMAPTVFEDKMLNYVQKNLRILSGFYGILKPMDGVTPYRLEMQAKARIDNSTNLYEFWSDRLYQELIGQDNIIINLASKEYSKCIETYLKSENKFITIFFGELSNGKVVQKGTYAKMARGEMVRFMAENEIEDPNEMKKFDRLGYFYSEELSTESKYVFIKNAEDKRKFLT